MPNLYEEEAAVHLKTERALADAQEEIGRLRAALFPFATSLKIARDAFDGPTDQGHLRAVAMNYIHIDDLCNASDVMRNTANEQSNG